MKKAAKVTALRPGKRKRPMRRYLVTVKGGCVNVPLRDETGFVVFSPGHLDLSITGEVHVEAPNAVAAIDEALFVLQGDQGETQDPALTLGDGEVVEYDVAHVRRLRKGERP